MTASSMVHKMRKHPSAKEERKLRKPLVERKRRERINQCLEQLKETVVGAFRLDQSKLEKADILEMTVKHLHNIQTTALNDSSSGVEAQQRYSTGYIQCMHEVHNMLLTCDWMDRTLGSRLLNHLLQSLPGSAHQEPLSRTPGPCPARSAHQRSPARSVGPRPTSQVVSSSAPRGGVSQAGGQRERHAAGHQEGAALLSSQLGMLDMWRPW